MSVETNKQTVQRFVEEVFNGHPSQGVQEFAAQDYLSHDPTGRAMPGLAQQMAGFRAASPDLHFTITQLLGEGDFVAVQWIARGTHQRPIAHLEEEFARPAGGKNVTLTGIWLFRFEGDKIAEVWNHWDRHHLLGQLSED